MATTGFGALMTPISAGIPEKTAPKKITAFLLWKTDERKLGREVTKAHWAKVPKSIYLQYAEKAASAPFL